MTLFLSANGRVGLFHSPQTPDDMDWSVHYPQYFDSSRNGEIVLR